MIKVRTKIENGKALNAQLLREAILLFNGEEVVITFEKLKRKRSNAQNAFYWGVVLPLITAYIRELGNEWNDIDGHNYLKSLYLKETIPVGDDGEFIERIKSTSSLDTVEWEVYIENIRLWAADILAYRIPLPNEGKERNNND